MDTASDKSILKRLLDLSRSITPKLNEDPEETVSRLIADLWEQTDTPPEVLNYLTAKMKSLAQNSLRRERRQRKTAIEREYFRRPTGTTMHMRAMDQTDGEILRGKALEVCEDDFDREALKLLTGELTDCSSVLQLIRRHGLADSRGYRKFESLKDRLRDVCVSLGLNN